MDLVTFGVQLLNAVQYGMVLFLVASGLTLVFGILGVINLAHGAFYMLGAYLAYWIVLTTGSFLLAMIGGVAIAFVVGLLLETVFVRLLYGRDHLAQVLLSFGLILVIDEIGNCCSARTSTRWRRRRGLSGSIQLTDNLSYPVYRLAICVFCLVVAGRDLPGHHPHQNRHDRARGRREPRDDPRARHQRSIASTAMCSRSASRWRRSAAS